MKLFYHFCIRAFLIFIATISLNSCKSLKRDVTKRSVLSVDAIQADQDYFTKAVLQYHLVDRTLKLFGVNKKDTINDNPIETMNISIEDPESSSLIVDCSYEIPQELEDLNSGFQYRYYLFGGESTAAMSAFGITDVNSTYDTKYLVIDYLQFKDCKCDMLPTIRYAVGIRSELRISSLQADAKIDGIASLANLAAQVQLGQSEVNFSLKTIGITGAESRLNIPQGVNFDVTTYKDFQNSIEFIKEKIDYKDDSLVRINPELIPVMDEYRPNSRATLDGITDEIITIHKEITKVDQDENLSTQAKREIKDLYQKEIEILIRQKKTLNNIHDLLYTLSTYEDFLDRTNRLKYGKEYLAKESNNARQIRRLVLDEGAMTPLEEVARGGTSFSIFNSRHNNSEYYIGHMNFLRQQGLIRFSGDNFSSAVITELGTEVLSINPTEIISENDWELNEDQNFQEILVGQESSFVLIEDELINWFNFSINSSDLYNISVESINEDPTIALFNNDYQLIDENDDIDETSLNSLIQVTLEPGTYYLGVRNLSSGQPMNYTVKIDR